MRIDPHHPRAESLRIRETLVQGVHDGITSTAGLLAHGRGEAFDYLLGETTHDFARRAIEAAAAYLLTAKSPILSINGNAAALVPSEFVMLAKLLNCKIEVNLFHHSEERIHRIETMLRALDETVVLDWKKSPKATLPGIASNRKTVIRSGIANADVVFVPLEDGDRCEALRALGKTVITVDLNPLSRTARSATVTIIDNIVRSLPLLIQTAGTMKAAPRKKKEEILKTYANRHILENALAAIAAHLKEVRRKT